MAVAGTVSLGLIECKGWPGSRDPATQYLPGAGWTACQGRCEWMGYRRTSHGHCDYK